MQLKLLPRRNKHENYYFYVILPRVRNLRDREMVETKLIDKAEGQSGRTKRDALVPNSILPLVSCT